ncbi:MULTISPECIES: S1 family peptidase [unclassified Streptomyces]|uniref:S1 family peptidase n=1 Tax=unclassified Streptomyces TaxID=2593676 RepID=UPI0033A680BB
MQMVHGSGVWTGVVDHSTLYGALRLDVERYDKGSGKTLLGHGTGFIVTVRDCGGYGLFAEFLVTNRHVVDPAFGPQGSVTTALAALTISGHHQPRGRRLSPKPVKAILRNPAPIYPDDPDIDLAVIRFDRQDREVLEGDGWFTSFTEQQIASPWVYEEADVYAGTQVLAAGYPSLGGQTNATRPILVGGEVPSDPRFPSEFEGTTYPDSALCHAFSRAGMSGAPVFAPIPKNRRHDEEEEPVVAFELGIIGVNAGHLRTAGTSDGVISHFVKSTALLRMLAGLGSQTADLQIKLADAFAVGQD